MEDSYPLNWSPTSEATAGRPRWVLIAGLGILFWVSPLWAAPVSTNGPATVTVSGFGFFGNRDMTRLLQNFQLNGKFPPVLDSSFVEDSAVVLMAHATDDGYLRGKLQADFKMLDGSEEHFTWTNALQALFPNAFAAREAHFKLKSGVRFYYKTLKFKGLKAFSRNDAESYFLSTDTLLRLHRNRVFSPSAMSSSLGALQTACARAGYEEATVTTNQVTINDSSGAVTVEVVIHEGLQSMVRSVKVTVHDDEMDTNAPPQILRPDEPYSQLWQQQLGQKLQSEQFTNGYPDATVSFSGTAARNDGYEYRSGLAGQREDRPQNHLGQGQL